MRNFKRFFSASFVIFLLSGCTEISQKFDSLFKKEEKFFISSSNEKLKAQAKKLFEKSNWNKELKPLIDIRQEGYFTFLIIHLNLENQRPIFKFSGRNYEALLKNGNEFLNTLSALKKPVIEDRLLCKLSEPKKGKGAFAKFIITKVLPKLKNFHEECLIEVLRGIHDRYQAEILAYLVERKDEESSYLLTRISRHDELENLQTVFFALAEIGNQEAISYLNTVSSGHPVSKIRNLAKEALSEIKKD